MSNLSWRVSVFLWRWRNRLRNTIAAPFDFRNWWDVFRLKFGLLTTASILEQRNGTKYLVRPRTTDLAVVMEAVCSNPYLKPGYMRLKPNSTVVDVGANIGDFTVQVARLCPQGRVYAVEPIAALCESIRRQLELNHIANIEVRQVALGGEDGEIVIHQAGAHSSSYWGDGKGERVRLCTLNSFMRDNSIERIDLLKMDCEGAEWDILPASVQVLSKVDQICLEYHNGKLTVDWLEKWLAEQGYTTRRTAGEWNGLVWAWRAGY